VKLLQWHPTSVDGIGPQISTSLTLAETAKLRELAGSNRVVEVGAAFGYSTIVMAQVAIDVVSVDPHEWLDSFDIFMANLEHYHVLARVTPLRYRFEDIAPTLPARYWDLVWIDGDHSPAAVIRDIQAASRLVRPGGRIAVHDYDEETCPGPRLACDQLLPHGELAVDTLWVADME
jgi:predicted O-methyltransferase YrrM